MQTAKSDLCGTDAFSRTSRCLHHADRSFPNPTYHPYAHPSFADSQTLNISTPSSTTLISCGTAGSQWKAPPLRSSVRRSMSTLSTNSSSSLRSLPHAPVRRADSFGETCKSMKRAPLFSVAAKSTRVSVAPYGKTPSTSLAESGSSAFAKASPIASGRTSSSLPSATSLLASHRRRTTNSLRYEGARLACVRTGTSSVFGTIWMSRSCANVSGAIPQVINFYIR